jgi:hypothetical protein
VYRVGDPRSLPTLANAASAAITILPGLPTTLAKNADAANPFGIFFADANTLYVADEGDGTTANAATSTNAGLQKWVLKNGVWTRVYVLQAGLNLGQPYTIANYPTPLNPATDGLRNIAGKVNNDGTVTIWGVTSTISTNGDQGADPNKLVVITDTIANTTAPSAASESFTTLRTANAGEVLRGVFADTLGRGDGRGQHPPHSFGSESRCYRDRSRIARDRCRPEPGNHHDLAARALSNQHRGHFGGNRRRRRRDSQCAAGVRIAESNCLAGTGCGRTRNRAGEGDEW